MVLAPNTEELVFECQGCGHLIIGHPPDDCEKCGGGHWTSPPQNHTRRRVGLIELVMIVRNEAANLPLTVPTYLPFIDSWTILDTGSTDGTQEIAEDLLRHVPGRLYAEEWPVGPGFDYGAARTRALSLARNRAEWLFMPDADMPITAAAVEGSNFTLGELRRWLEPDPDPSVDAWSVHVLEGSAWWKPLLFRGTMEWEYKGKRHEYLETQGRHVRRLLGLRLLHDSSGPSDGKYDEYAEALREEAEAGEPRAVFYYAESLRFAGRTDDAIQWYLRRAQITAGFDEERWYAAYMAAKLTSDVAALVECWEDRPWRHEPLTAAARLVAANGADRDVLFLEPGP